jgi:hypothetical protein
MLTRKEQAYVEQILIAIVLNITLIFLQNNRDTVPIGYFSYILQSFKDFLQTKV